MTEAERQVRKDIIEINQNLRDIKALKLEIATPNEQPTPEVMKLAEELERHLESFDGNGETVQNNNETIAQALSAYGQSEYVRGYSDGSLYEHDRAVAYGQERADRVFEAVISTNCESDCAGHNKNQAAQQAAKK